MFKRQIFLLFALLNLSLLFCPPVQAQLPQITAGINYLSSSQNPDGTWETATSLVETTETTVSVLETLKLLNQTAGSSYTAGLAWLQAQSPRPVDYLAEKIHLLNLTGGSVDALFPALDPARGAWGGFDGFASDNLDNALALQALRTANYGNPDVIFAAISYLTLGQNADGGWGFNNGDDSNVYMTSIVSAVLQQFPQISPIATAINRATSYLTAHQNVDGGFGNSPSTVHDTALAYAALAAVTTDATVLSGATTYLTATQSADGSWNDDPYQTALALKALHLEEQKPPPPPPPPPGGKISGTVVEATTNVKLRGVAVVLQSNPMVNTVTDASGNFTLNDVPAGDQKVNFTLSGYAALSVPVSVTEGAIINLGTITMVSSYLTGSIAGTVTDPAGHALADVAVTVTGIWSGSAMTGADGSYAFNYVTPGPVTISVAKSGYQTLTSTGTVFARTTLTFSPRLSATPPQGSTGSIIGRVVEAESGLPIDHLDGEEGVTVRVSGGIVVEPDADNGGRFSIDGLQPNTYQVTAGMPGFTSKTFRVVILPGVTTDLGTIRISMTINTMNLTGKITDAATGDPIPGAEVSVMGTNLAGRADFAGTYMITDIDHPSEFTLKASANGYIDKTFIVGTAPWTHTIDIALTKQVTTGGLTGTVVDASSGQPLNGVSATLVDDPSVSTATNSSGVFTFNALQKGARQVTLALSGYAQLTVTVKITAGQTNNVGQIALSVNPAAASVRGTVWDAVANAPFAGVEIQVSGTGFWQTITAADGTYRVDNVNPGMVTVAATAGPKPGYFGAKFTGPLAPGGVLIFSPSLSKTPPPGILKGTVTDLNDGMPIRGASIALTPMPAGSNIIFTDAAGTFSVTDIPVGSYKVTVSAPGYVSQNVLADIISGYLGETTITVQLQKPNSSTTIAGKVLDAATGAPIANASVAITGTSLTATSGADGVYSLSGITALEFRVMVSADGYDSYSYGIKTNGYGNYTMDLRIAKTGMTSTTISGVVTDAATNKPIAGAEVSVRGTDKSALTGADGKYSITGIADMVLNLKASATGYDTKYTPLTENTYGEYEVSFALDKSRVSTVVIKSLATDKPAYATNEHVAVLAEIENIGDAPVEMSVGGQVSDQYGNVLGLLSLPGDPLTLASRTAQTVSLQWNTERNAPGPYQISFTVVDRTFGGVLAEGRTAFTISTTSNVDGLVPLITPKFINIKATETIGLSLYLVNRSNADTQLSAQYEMKNPDGSLLRDGTVDFSLAAAEAFKTIPLTEFTNTFVKSGQYPVTVKVLSGGAPVAQADDAIYVAPSIRIEPTQNLDPVTVVPDGDKDIRINIQLKGVEEQP